MPYGKYGETLVTYYNRIRKGRIKICKQIPYTSQDSLGGKDFTFNWTVDGKKGTVTLKPGECTYVIGDFNIIDPNGDPTPVSVTEVVPVGCDVVGRLDRRPVRPSPSSTRTRAPVSQRGIWVPTPTS